MQQWSSIEVRLQCSLWCLQPCSLGPHPSAEAYISVRLTKQQHSLMVQRMRQDRLLNPPLVLTLSSYCSHSSQQSLFIPAHASDAQAHSSLLSWLPYLHVVAVHQASVVDHLSTSRNNSAMSKDTSGLRAQLRRAVDWDSDMLEYVVGAMAGASSKTDVDEIIEVRRAYACLLAA